MTATELAADFAARADEYGTARLSRKQVDFLSSLVSRDLARFGTDASPSQRTRSQGGTMLLVYLPGDRCVEVAVLHNGAGLMKVVSA